MEIHENLGETSGRILRIFDVLTHQSILRCTAGVFLVSVVIGLNRKQFVNRQQASRRQDAFK